MRNAILTLAVVFALASVAAAVPAGPGGTIYFERLDAAGGTQKIYYLDVDAGWNALGSVTLLTTFADAPPNEDSHTYGLRPWSADMGGSYHSATLLTQAYYDNDDAVGTGNRGSDILLINPDGSQTVINRGFNGSEGTNTAGLDWIQPVNSNFTPGGEARGIVAQSDSGHSIWLDTNGDGFYEEDGGSIPGLASNGGDVGFMLLSSLLIRTCTTGAIQQGMLLISVWQVNR